MDCLLEVPEIERAALEADLLGAREHLEMDDLTDVIIRVSWATGFTEHQLLPKWWKPAARR